MMLYIANFIGIVGVIIILVGYLLLQFGLLHATNVWFSVLNLVGSLMILFSLFFAWNLPAVIIETAWACISVHGIFRTYTTE